MANEQGTSKRKAEHVNGDAPRKKSKPWKVVKKSPSSNTYTFATTIEAGDAGIWVTCDLNKEAKCTAELTDLFNEYASILYGPTEEEDGQRMGSIAPADGDGDGDIEAEISKELDGLRNSRRRALFQPVRLDVKCVLFFRTRAPVEPVSFVHKICSDALESASLKKHRWIRRLTPMSLMGKATEKGLETVSKAVLGPAFHEAESTPKKFAIRTTIRNHSGMKKDDVIKQVAALVGDQHQVDLKHYDLLILVEIYQNICGMSIVGRDFEKLKRFNLAEIYDPQPKAGDTGGTRTES